MPTHFHLKITQLFIFIVGVKVVFSLNWEVKTFSGDSYDPPRFAISLEDHSSAFSSAAYCVDNNNDTIGGGWHDGQVLPQIVSYDREICDECHRCEWKQRKGFATELDWQAAVTAEMRRLEGGGGGDNCQQEIVGTWIAGAPYSLELSDSIVHELGSALGISVDSAFVTDTGGRRYFIVSGTPSSVAPGLLAAGFSSLTPIPPRLKVDPVLEEHIIWINGNKEEEDSRGGNSAADASVDTSSITGLHAQVSTLHTGDSVVYPNTTVPLLRSSHLLSASWTGMLTARLGHDKAEVMAEGGEDVIIRGLASRSELYRAALDIAHHGEVKWVAPHGHLTTSNYFASQLVQSGTWYIPEAWGEEGGIPDRYNPLSAMGLTGRGEVVGMADTGLDYTSCFFEDEKYTPTFKWDEAKRIKNRPGGKFDIWKNKKHRKIVQYVAYMNGVEDDVDGHGTHVCGSAVGGHADEDIINRDYHGVAPDAKIAFFDTRSTTEEVQNSIPSNMADLVFKHAYDAGARVYILATNIRSQSAYSSNAKSLDKFCYWNRDFVAVVSVGNAAKVQAPAESKNAVVVGSHFNPDKAYGLPPTDPSHILGVDRRSARGPTLDGRIKPDVCGPGSNVYSAASYGPITTENWNLDLESENCRGVVKHGTSSAAAIVGGLTVLVRQYFKEGHYYTHCSKNKKNKKKKRFFLGPSGALVKAILINSGRNLDTNGGHNIIRPNYIKKRPDNNQGWGGVNLASTLVTPSSPQGLQLKVYGECLITDLGHCVAPEGAYIRAGETNEYIIQTSEDTYGLPLKVTLVWYDRPTQSSSRRSVVHDLDLTVTENAAEKKDNVWYFANGLSAYDTKNTVEHIEVPQPKPTTIYTLRVLGRDLPKFAMQDIALVISGPFDSQRVQMKRTENATKPNRYRNDQGW